MKLTKEGRFAIRGVIDIALHSRNGKAVKIDDAAERMVVSKIFLNKIFYRLTRNGVLISVRGRNGGYILGGKGNEINLYEILIASGETMLPVDCSNTPSSQASCNLKSKCLITSVWGKLGLIIKDTLTSYSINDIIEGKVSID